MPVNLRPLSTFARGPKVERIVGYFIVLGCSLCGFEAEVFGGGE